MSRTSETWPQPFGGSPQESPQVVVLVEGTSDQVALETLARRCGRDLEEEGVCIAPMGGATNIAHFLDRYGPFGLNLRLAGLCDVGEEGDFRRGLERVGFGTALTRADLESFGFFVCVVDLEDELIRSLGVDQSRRSSRRRESLGLSESCRDSRCSGIAATRRNFGASWALAPAERSTTPGIWSRRLIWLRCQPHLPVCLLTSSPQGLVASPVSSTAVRHRGACREGQPLVDPVGNAPVCRKRGDWWGRKEPGVDPPGLLSVRPLAQT